MTQNINDGGPAFPFAATDQSNVKLQAQGMTLRDYFAGQALAGAMADHTWSSEKYQTAEWAYAIADAMLEARNAK